MALMGSINKPCRISDIRARGADVGLKALASWNASGLLSATKGLAINTSSGRALFEAGKQHLRKRGITKISPAASKVATDLRVLLKRIGDAETKPSNVLN
jgi:hypothetical protein